MPTNESVTGAPESHDLRDVFNALFYVVKRGIPWRQMPHDLPPWKTAYYYFRKFQRLGIWQELNDAIREKVRQKAGRKISPKGLALVVHTGRQDQAIGFK